MLTDAPEVSDEPVPYHRPPQLVKGEEQIPVRRFENNELAHLASVSTSIECECPKHLVDLVLSLNAFEAYSAACTIRTPDDAVLHGYLHSVTANARAQMEEALERVARAEGLLGS